MYTPIVGIATVLCSALALQATAPVAVRAARRGTLIFRPGGGRAMLCRTGWPERRRIALIIIKKSLLCMVHECFVFSGAEYTESCDRFPQQMKTRGDARHACIQLRIAIKPSHESGVRISRGDGGIVLGINEACGFNGTVFSAHRCFPDS